MLKLFVVKYPKNWPLQIPGVEVVSARDYVTNPRFNEVRPARVFNLSRSYRYMSTGYYVSLLAEARGHKPIPTVATLQSLRSDTEIRVVSEELDELIQKTLAPLKADRFVLSIYFGHNVAARYDRLSGQLFGLFEAPLLRATFVRNKRWALHNVVPIAVSDIPEAHLPTVVAAAEGYFRRGSSKRRRRRTRYDLAILHNPQEAEPPSDEKALARFCRAAETVGLEPELITRADYRRIAEFDALFIRETTQVNHPTYRFAHRAAAEGMPVIDDPESIIRCTNKVYLAELFDRYRLPMPRTMVVHTENADRIVDTLKLPCILKRPDSSFSQGVVKASTPEILRDELTKMLDDSDLVIAQEFVPTEFDWRVGVLAGEPLYVCKYYMAHHHWQILKKDRSGNLRAGRVETLAVENAPRGLVRLAVRACRRIGGGFYGVDIKKVGRRFVIMEINDNPSIDAGYEDRVLKQELYLRVMRHFLRLIERTKEA